MKDAARFERLYQRMGAVPITNTNPDPDESSWALDDLGFELVFDGPAPNFSFDRSVRVIASEISAGQGERVDVDGTTYVVRQREPIDDGFEVVLLLGEV